MSDDELRQGLRQAIKKGMQTAGWRQPSDDTLRQIENEVNIYLSNTANEAEKDARRKVAVEQILRHDWTSTDDVLDAIIKEAQG